MFVTDTVDAVYRPEAWIPESVMDQLAEIIVDLPDLRVRSFLFPHRMISLNKVFLRLTGAP